MQSSEGYIQNLKQWLRDTADSPLEEMSDFFTKRLHDYEEHMSIWEKSYQIFAEILPLECQKILDLGCGTGLELDKIWQKNPNIQVTGVDLCANMLDKLLEKHHDKPLITVCQDYFQYDFEYDKWDAVISFESLHHFMPKRKKELYRKICCSLKENGVFILGDYIACCDEEEELLPDKILKIEFHPGDILYFINDEQIGSTGPHCELRTIAYKEVEKLLSLKNGRQLFLLLLPLAFIEEEDIQSVRDKIAEQMKSYFSENLCESVSGCIVAGLA